ncbi:MAG: class I SAM-dependent methyltransferase [Candidatus Eisenbacteria bacterium]|nr:class I SAM-dependent methyltransferase [Candidatus Eisenbacteria bacterium]
MYKRQFAICSIHLGDQLGFYQVLAEDGPLTSIELARRTGTHERYVREWLEQQAVCGVLGVEDARLDATSRRFFLPEAHVEALARRDSPGYLAPIAQAAAGLVRPLPEIVQAYRTGGGVPFAAYGSDMRLGQARLNRGIFLNELGKEWLPAVASIDARLRSKAPAAVADVGCGAGWSCIGIALAYPNVTVDGFDLDEPSIELARANLAETAASASRPDLLERVRFHVRDAADPSLAGTYDLATLFECLHDMSDPAGTLRNLRRLLRDGGEILIMDERVADRFDPHAGGFEWLMYGASVFHCLPAVMAEQPSAATGTVMRTDTVRRYAQEAGFRDLEVLPIGNELFRFYRPVA